MGGRQALTAVRIVDAAVEVADRGGLGAVSMRNVGKQLGVEAMSLYHHVANKEALLDALADWVFSRVVIPWDSDDWRTGMVRRARSAREVLVAHPWALGLLESRANPGPALLAHHNAILGCLRRGGFSVRLASHAYSVIDAYVYGFALTEQNLPFDSTSAEGAEGFAADAAAAISMFPYLAELVGGLVGGEEGYAFADEFDYGLDLILDQLEVRLTAG